MSLSSGTRLGPYEVLGPLGAGGMGEVYLARDPRLGRDVAIKVLPEHLAHNPDLRQRFEREARAVSSLNHPHICVLHDIGNQDGVAYLVLEYLEGESLHDRLEKGPLSLDQALRYGIQIADALDRAHRHGVIHRDLKPANVMLTKSGAKLLDFGLARNAKPILSGDPDLSALATPSKPLTAKGTLLGTVQYMSPEQIEGREADARTDIWALGCVLYEMVTGKRAFEATSPASLIGAILKDEPRPMRELKPLTPPSLERLVKTCLAKDPDERWQNAHDVVAELRWVLEGGSGATVPEAARRLRLERLAWITATVLLLFLAAVQAARDLGRRPAESRPVRLSVNPPERAAVDSISLSPDGQHLAFAGTSSDGSIVLWVRSLESYAAREIPGTHGTLYPFWSPDSRFIGFFAQGKLKKVAVSGGVIETLTDASQPRGGSWSREGIVVFTPNLGSGLYRVSATGGEAAPVTTLDPSKAEYSHRWPSFLPDGRHFLYYAFTARAESKGVWIGSLDSKETRRLRSEPSNAAYSPPGYVLFDRDGTLMAVPFDVRGLRTSGEPAAVAEGLAYDAASRTDFAISDKGVLAFRSAGSLDTQLTWFDRGGKPIGTVGPSGSDLGSASLSRDGRIVAASRSSSKRGMRDVWLLDRERGTSSRLTFNAGTNFATVWSPDGSRVAYASTQAGPANIYAKAATGVGEEERLLKMDQSCFPSSWSRDARYIAFTSPDAITRLDLWVLPLGGERKPVAFRQTRFDEMDGQFSPDGRWMAYASNESGQFEVYVQSFPPAGGGWQVSNRGGLLPRWRGDGKELFYVGLDQKMMAVDISATASFESGAPRELFDVRALEAFRSFWDPYSVTADGQRFLITMRAPQARASPISVILDWTAGLR